MVNFSHKREINEALITENDHECAICSCKEQLRHTVAYSEDISSYAKERLFLRHCPGARSLKLNKPFQRKRVYGHFSELLSLKKLLKSWLYEVKAWIQLSDLFCFWKHPALPYRVKHFYKQLEERTLLSATFLEKRLCNHLDVSSTFMPTISHQLVLCKERHFYFIEMILSMTADLLVLNQVDRVWKHWKSILSFFSSQFYKTIKHLIL